MRRFYRRGRDFGTRDANSFRENPAGVVAAGRGALRWCGFQAVTAGAVQGQGDYRH